MTNVRTEENLIFERLTNIASIFKSAGDLWHYPSYQRQLMVCLPSIRGWQPPVVNLSLATGPTCRINLPLLCCPTIPSPVFWSASGESRGDLANQRSGIFSQSKYWGDSRSLVLRSAAHLVKPGRGSPRSQCCL